MKKLFALLLIAGCGVSFVGCTKTEDPKADAPKVETPADSATPADSTPVAPDAPAAPEAPPATTPEAPAEPAPAEPKSE